MSGKTYLTYEEIESFVFENEETLKKATLRELYEFAEDNGFNSGIEFNLYKQALSEIDVNYDEMRERKNDRRRTHRGIAHDASSFRCDV